MKQDAIRRQGLIERGLAMIKPETKLESSLMGTLKKTFDPKRLATNFALRKMGLGWLNPLAGLASLFFPKQAEAFKSKFAKKPTFDQKKASQLGLYADRQPTQYAKARDAYKQPDLTKQIAGKGDVISKSIAKFTGKGDDRSGIEGQQAGLKDMSTYQKVKFHKLDSIDKMDKSGVWDGPPLTDEEKQELKELRKLRKSEMISSTGTVVAAHGGRIDSPLMGRSRYI